MHNNALFCGHKGLGVVQGKSIETGVTLLTIEGRQGLQVFYLASLKKFNTASMSCTEVPCTEMTHVSLHVPKLQDVHASSKTFTIIRYTPGKMSPQTNCSQS